MTLKTVQEYYPTKDTIVGYYTLLNTFRCHSAEDLRDMDKWLNPSFTEPQEGFFNFVRYIGHYGFEIWCFAYERVAGYLSLGEFDDFFPMTYSEDMGWEEVHPDIDDGEHFIFTKNEFGETPDVEMIAAAFDTDAYDNGYIFTSKQQLIDFVKQDKF